VIVVEQYLVHGGLGELVLDYALDVLGGAVYRFVGIV